MYYIGKVAYDTVSEKGKSIVKKDEIVVEAHSFTDAESTAYSQYEFIISGDFDVSAMRKTKIKEIIGNDSDIYFHCIVSFLDADEKTGKEKEVNEECLINAYTFSEAFDKIKDEFKNTTIPFRFKSIKETKIVDVFYINE